MAKIKGKDTSPEILLRKALWHRGVRYRKNVKELPGSPDIVITRFKIAIFVDGEFWHGHNWAEKKKRLKTNREFWVRKIERNIARDKRVNYELTQIGYTTIRFWSTVIKRQPQYCVDYVVGLMHAVNAFSRQV